MALPAAGDFTGSGITQAQFKTAISELRTFLATLLGTDGTVATALAALDTLFAAGVTAKSSSYTVAATDRGQLFDCTATWTLTLPAAAAAGAGFAFAVRNSGSGVITIDGDGSETVDGAATITLAAGASAVIVCTGTAWLSVGLAAPVSYPISVANGGTGSGATPTASNSPQADNIKAVKHDHGHNNVGSFCFASHKHNSAINPGGTIAGSSLKPAGVGKGGTGSYNSALAGTWRCLGFCKWDESDYIYASLFQRIA